MIYKIIYLISYWTRSTYIFQQHDQHSKLLQTYSVTT